MATSPIFNMRNMNSSHASARAVLLRAEAELVTQIESVAALRRSLPENPIPEDYVFTEATPERTPPVVSLSELLVSPDRPAVIYHFMFKPGDPAPCPMCVMWLDGFNAMAAHIAQRIDFAVVAKARADVLGEWASKRGWGALRLLSSSECTFNSDFGMEDGNGKQLPGISVFVMKPDGSIAHTYTGSAILGGGHFRGLDLLNPVWNLFDLAPTGRGNFLPRLSYQQDDESA